MNTFAENLMSTQIAASSQTKRTKAGRAVPSDPSTGRPEGHLIGYARVSTAGQDTATQEAKLKAAGCTLIRTETVSGAPGTAAMSSRRSSTSFARAMSSSWSSWTA